MPVRSILASTTMRNRIVLGASLIGVVFVAFMLFRLAAQPSLTVVSSGIDPAQVDKISAALDERGIGYELRNNGTAIAVDEAKRGEARVALAAAGVGGGSTHEGFELLDEQKLGSSSFQQQVSYQRALEGEIAKTIEQVQGVGSAQVQLVLPEDSLFAEDQETASAAVLLGASDDLDAGAVAGIANLVASSVKSLDAKRVTITDATGQMLWPNETAGEGAVSAAGARAAEERYARQLEASLGGLIMQTVGAENARVQVHADLDTDKVSKNELTYGKEGIPLSTRTEEENLEGSGASGAAGTGGNVQGLTGGAGGASNYERRSEETSFGVDKTVTRRQVTPGAVQRLQVALVVDKDVAAADAEALQSAISAAAGIDPERGDTIELQQLSFVEAPEPKEEEKSASPVPIPAGMGTPIKYAALGLGVLLFLFFVSRHLRRRETEELASPTWLREIEAPRSLAELEAPSIQVKPKPPSHRKQVEEIVEREPERVAHQVRSWIQED